ncbi:hypothetical protein NW762_004209 [Fusarium torreyae]|uniref:Uncharacterized protein n=1 Tax=Fusarium torreyae TaxID=1237075 RepID=A0A9W8S8J0_9HYPO|nr:hypothetical protein NW762_004209 [Fusarium torreyae]
MSSIMSDPEDYTYHHEDSVPINMDGTMSDPEESVQHHEDSIHINMDSTISDPEDSLRHHEDPVYYHEDSIHYHEDSIHYHEDPVYYLDDSVHEYEDFVHNHKDFILDHENFIHHPNHYVREYEDFVHEHKDSVLDHEDSDHESAFNNATSFPELFPNQPQKKGDNVPYRRPRFLIWGRCRFITRRLKFMIQMQGYLVRKTIFRGGEPKDMMKKLDQHRPSHVFIPVFPSDLDGWEKNKEEATITDIVEPLNLITCCWQRDIHCTVFISGDNYKYDESHPQGGRSFTEDDLANLTGDSLSKAHYHVSNIMSAYSNCLVLRLRLPIGYTDSPKNYLTQILTRERAVDIPNSCSVIPDLLPAAIVLAMNKETGVFNFTNPGAIRRDEILSMFINIVRPELRLEDFPGRPEYRDNASNCKLDTTKLTKTLAKYGHQVQEVHDALRELFEKMRADDNGTMLRWAFNE